MHEEETGTSPVPAGVGDRVRAVRRAAGLSQTDLAGEDLHASYVSLIESGKRRPTPDVVRRLAVRLGVTEDYLLHGEDPETAARATLAVTYAEIAVRNGEAADALAQVESVLHGDGRLGGPLRDRAERVRAHALEALGRLKEAAAVLESLAEQAAADHRWNDHLARTVDLVRCYQQAGDNDYSIDLARRALDRVGTLGLAGSDEHAQLASTLVGSYYVRGDLTKAALEAQRALTAVEARGSARARGSVLWNAALVAEAEGDVGSALALAERSLALFAEGDDARAVARLQVAYAWLLLRSTPPDAAEAHAQLSRAHASLRDVGAATDLASCETELAVAELLGGEPDRALDLLDAAAGRLSAQTPIELATTHLVRGRVLMSRDGGADRAGATAEYRQAADLLAEATSGRTAASVWRELADAYTRLGLFEDAGMAYQQALNDVGITAAPEVRDPVSPR